MKSPDAVSSTTCPEPAPILAPFFLSFSTNSQPNVLVSRATLIIAVPERAGLAIAKPSLNLGSSMSSQLLGAAVIFFVL